MRRTAPLGTEVGAVARRARGAGRRLVAGPALLALATAACGGGGTPDSTPSPSRTVSSPPPTTTLPTGSLPPAATLPPGCVEPTPAPDARLMIATVTGGVVRTESPRYEIPLGVAVRILVTTDVPDEVHVHGYDLRARTTSGCPVAIDLTTSIPGTVEVELENAHLELFELRSR